MIEHPHPSVWEIDGAYILKQGDNPAYLEKSILLSRLLREEGIPTVQYLPTLDGAPFVSVKNGYWCLMPKLRGSHVDIFDRDDPFTLEIGKMIARLHIALKKIESAALCEERDLIRELQDDVLPRIQKNGLPVPGGLQEAVRSRFKRDYADLPRQFIHRDLHMGNLLFEGDALTGYIDFDLSIRDVRIFDLCYFTLTALPGRTLSYPRWKHYVQMVVAGYDAVLPLTETEKAFMPYLSLYIELLFAAYWAQTGNTEQVDESLRLVNWLWMHHVH